MIGRSEMGGEDGKEDGGEDGGRVVGVEGGWAVSEGVEGEDVESVRVEGESVVGSPPRWDELLLMFCGMSSTLHNDVLQHSFTFRFLFTGSHELAHPRLKWTAPLLRLLHVEKHQLSESSSHRRTWSSFSDSELLS